MLYEKNALKKNWLLSFPSNNGEIVSQLLFANMHQTARDKNKC